MTAATCIANLKILTDVIDKTARVAAEGWIDSTLEDSKENFCPEDTGSLKQSGRKEIVEDNSMRFTIKILYGGTHETPPHIGYHTRSGADGKKIFTNYAIYVHEVPHKHDHGSWKYLSIPFNNASSKLIQDIAGKVKP